MTDKLTESDHVALSTIFRSVRERTPWTAIRHRPLRWPALVGVGILVVALAGACSLRGNGASSESTQQAETVPPTSWPGGTWSPPDPSFAVDVQQGVEITMSDGVILRGAVGYPADATTGERAAGPFPVILTFSPYVEEIQEYFVERGYIFAAVNSRGTQQSGGEFMFNSPRDHRDGVEVVEWAAGLDGSSGDVGGYGCSWPGQTQIFTAATIGPNSPLKAIIPACAAFENLREDFLLGGLPTGDFEFFTGVSSMIGDQPSARKFLEDLERNIRAGGDAAYDREFWQGQHQFQFAADVVANGIPTLLWSGWDDVAIKGALEFYTAQQNTYVGRDPLAPMLPDQQADPRTQIIVGPWSHGEGLDRGIMLQWYETWLKGADTGLLDTKTPMHLFEEPTGRWVNASSYPMTDQYRSFYLGADGQLGTSSPDTEGADRIRWTQPESPDGHLDYTTAPFDEGATLAGPFSAVIHARSSNSNLVLIATVLDVAPDGTETPISFGAVLGSQRGLDPDRSWVDEQGISIRPFTVQREDELLEPGVGEVFEIAVHPRLWSVEPGHAVRLRLTTQGSEAACAEGALVPCSLTAPQQRTVPGGSYEILRSRDAASTLNLPVLPYQCLGSARSGKTDTSEGYDQPLDWSSENAC